jgi:predicted nucleic acid-binding protein
MRQRVFADAGYWIGLFNPRDHLHAKAVTAFREFRPRQIVTSEMVLTELLNHFSEGDTRLRRSAAKGVASLRALPEIFIVPQSSELFARAFERYQAMSDKGWTVPASSSWKTRDWQSL